METKKLPDLGEKSHSVREEPASYTKELLLDKAGIGGSALVPGSPASQICPGYVKPEMQIKYFCVRCNFCLKYSSAARKRMPYER